MLLIQFPAKPFLDDIPAVAGFGIGLEIFQPLVKDFSVPIRDGKSRVAAARTLGIRLWIMMRDQIDYEEFCRRGPARPS